MIMVGDGKHRWASLYYLSYGYGMAMRFIPLKCRFQAAFFLSQKLKGIIKLTTAYKEQIGYHLDDIESISLALFLNAMTKAGTLFDPVYTVRGAEKLRSVSDKKNGTLMVGVHGQLHGLIVRHLVDSGYTPIVINEESKYSVAGSKRKIRSIVPGPHVLLHAQRALKSGQLVMALIDLKEELKGRSMEMKTINGPVYIATPILQVATYCSASILFFRILVRRKEVVISIDSPSEREALTVDGLSQQFINFLNANQN